MSVTIRQARVRDVAGIHHLVMEGTKHGKILRRSTRDIKKIIRHFWVAEEDGNLIACCALEIYNKKLAEIRSLVVSPAAQKKGVATGLLNHCLSLARKKRIYEVLAITDRENLFKRLGFSEQLHGQKSLFVRP